MQKKLLSLMLVGVITVMLLSACGPKENPLTGADDSQSSSASVKPPASSEEPEPTPEPTPEPLDAAFLTGLEKDANYPDDKRVTAIMVANNVEGRPHYGFKDAKILFEITVEYHITRFMAVYEDYAQMPRVGPMRSARDQFIQLLLPMSAFFIHDGPAGDVPANWYLRDYANMIKDLGIANAYRDSDGGTRSAPLNEFTDGEKITKKVENGDFKKEDTYKSTVFIFGRYDEEPRVPADGTAKDLGIVFQPSFRTLFNYNAETHEYEMYQYNSNRGTVDKAIDANYNEQVTFDNVMVIFAPYTFYDSTPLPKFNYYGGGGFYFSEGGWESMLWKKTSPNEPLRLYEMDNETQLTVNPGRSYVAVVGDELAQEFYDNLVAGTSWGYASKGNVNTNLQDADD